MVFDVINIFKEDELFKTVIESKNFNLFKTNIDNSLVTSGVNYIGNNFIGKYWIKVNNIAEKLVINLVNVVSAQVFNEFSKEFERCKKMKKDNSYIVVIDKIQNMQVFKFLNNYSKTNKSYIFNYYYLDENSNYYVTYNDIDYVLYNESKNIDCSN